MAMQLTYVIRFVADMPAATAFFRDTLGLTLRFQSPGWTEFETGATTLALHPAIAQSPAGSCQIGFKVDDVVAFHHEMAAKGYVFTQSPRVEHGVVIARFLDRDGAEISVSSLPR
jgi:catechol 2,3-dioxygenase-like lactoylglutathione lyase family enzyme